jgi:hypothetical protein
MYHAPEQIIYRYILLHFVVSDTLRGHFCLFCPRVVSVTLRGQIHQFCPRGVDTSYNDSIICYFFTYKQFSFDCSFVTMMKKVGDRYV